MEEEEHGEDALATVISGRASSHCCRCPKWRRADLTCQAAGEGQTMSPSQRRVGGRKKGGHKAAKQKGATGNRTLPTATSVRNLGQSPRVLGSQVILDGGRNRLPSRRGIRESLPRPSAVMSLLSMAVVPEERHGFQRRFRRAAKDGGECGPVGEFLTEWLQVPSGVSRPNCVRSLTCSLNRGCSRNFLTNSTSWM